MRKFKSFYSHAILEFIDFISPFDKSFGYGPKYFNMKHPITQKLVKLAALCMQAESQNSLPQDQIGIIKDFFDKLGGRGYGRYSFREWISTIKEFWLFVQKIKLIEVDKIEKLIPSKEEFVTGTIKSNKDGVDEIFIPDFSYQKGKVRPFGQPLKK